MKEYKKRKSDLKRPRSEERPQLKSKDRSEDQMASRAPAIETKSAKDNHIELLGDERASLPVNATQFADLVGQFQQIYGNSYVQRLLSDSGEIKPSEALKGSAGAQIDSENASVMESAFREDFSGVRIHTDQTAENAAKELGAKAFTHGDNIYFGPGEYEPATSEGEKLLAHELAHVIQQKKSSTNSHNSAVSHSGDTLEHEADLAAADVLSGKHPQVTSHGEVPAFQRQEERQQAPSIRRHGRQITPTPPQGTIDAGGQFSVTYQYNVVSGADYVPLTLAVPSGVGVSVIPLSHLTAADFRVIDPGGSGARAVTISVSAHMRQIPRIQVTFTKDNFTYLVVFQFPQSSSSSETSETSQE